MSQPLRRSQLGVEGGECAEVDFEVIAAREGHTTVRSRIKKETRPSVGCFILQGPRRRNASLQISYDFYFLFCVIRN